MVVFICFLKINSYTNNNNDNNVVRIGVYEYEPCITVNSNGEISGYYADFFKKIKGKYDFEYEYVVCSLSEGLKKLKSGEIDIMPGIPINSDYEEIIYNKYSIQDERFGLYISDYMNGKFYLGNYINFDKTLKLGLVKDDYNAYWILEFFKVNNINVEVINKETYKELYDLLSENKIDAMIDNIYNKDKYNMVYEFASSPIYIAGNKESRFILDKIDEAINDFVKKGKNKLIKLQNKYFEKNYKLSLYKKIVLFLSLIITSLISIIFGIIPSVKKRIIVNKIKNRMCNGKYLLNYQPIYNPRNREIIGFEGLLRLKGKEDKLISPYEFIPEIESNNMLYDISIWVLNRAIEDYEKIGKLKSMIGREFYISINISLNEIENDKFVKEIIEILSKSKLNNNQICLEIIERVKINDIDKITKNIDLLKKAGFKIAIDDFGVEYSNLDVLQKLDIDIIKVDKNFVDGVGKDIIRNEIIKFISKIARVKNKSVVLEGVEEERQHHDIKKIENNLLYVQGYYYNKPMGLEEVLEIL